MNLEDWINNINNLDDLYLSNKLSLISFISNITSKYLTLTVLNLPNNIKEFNNYDYTLIWDCEFQIFSSNNKCNHIIRENNLIRCISEFGMILLLNIKNIIYIGGMFHSHFLNYRFNSNIDNYMPFYHEYLSTSHKTEQKIISIEQLIFPHLIFIDAWNKFIKNNNIHLFTSSILKLLSHKLLKINKYILKKFKDQLQHLISLLETSVNPYTDMNIIMLINKINSILKNVIYSKQIKSYNKTKLFNKIFNLYINDSYIKSIEIPTKNHANLIYYFIDIVKYNKCLNIIKGFEDLKALNNHGLLYNCIKENIINNNNIKYIDIADYNDILYQKCSSAKLYDTYIYLMRDNLNENWSKKTNKIIKDYMKLNMKPHNPLVDAYYTLMVYIGFNKFNK